mmetsp:Transcript_92225/g.260830  ORF Transcript_92225/g.260830 Transcript_92225/m.260830 type:complete len:368 (-) Transcript_92225:2769-3872(-)
MRSSIHPTRVRLGFKTWEAPSPARVISARKWHGLAGGDGRPRAGWRRRRSASCPLRVAAAASLDGVLDGGCAGLRGRRRILVRRIRAVFDQDHRHVDLQLVLEILHILLQQGELVEGHAGLQGRRPELHGLVALEGRKRSDVLGHRLQRGILHELLHDGLPLRLRQVVLLQLLLGDERQLSERQPRPHLRQNAQLPLGVLLRHVHGGRDGLARRLAGLLRLLLELDEVVRHLFVHVPALGDQCRVHGGRRGGPAGIEHGARLAQEAPPVLAEVRGDGGEDDHLPLQVPQGQSLVRKNLPRLADVAVLIETPTELVERRPAGLAVVHLGVELLGLLDQSVHGVREPAVHEAPTIFALVELLTAAGDRL